MAADGDVVWLKNGNLSDHEAVWDDSALIEAYDRAVNQVKETIMVNKETSNAEIPPSADVSLQYLGSSQDETTRRNSNTGNGKKKGKNKKSKGQKRLWKIGDYCQAVYSEDGQRYEAYIKEVNQSGSSCLVQYLGYGNEEIVNVSELGPSLGKVARQQQETNAGMTVKPEPTNDTVSEASSQHSISRGKRRSRNNQWGGAMRFPPDVFTSYHQGSLPGPPNHAPGWFAPTAPASAPSHPHVASCPFIGSSHNNHHQHPVAPQIPPPPPFPIDHNLVHDEEALAAMLMSWYMSGYHTGYYQAMRQTKIPRKSPSSCCMHSSR